MCNRQAMGDLKQEVGYKGNREILFELPEDVFDREETLKKVLKTCTCKTGCKSARCSCLKINLSCVLCNCEHCENRTKLTPEEVANFRSAQEHDFNDFEEEDAKHDCSSDEESDDDNILEK